MWAGGRHLFFTVNNRSGGVTDHAEDHFSVETKNQRESVTLPFGVDIHIYAEISRMAAKAIADVGGTTVAILVANQVRCLKFALRFLKQRLDDAINRPGVWGSASACEAAIWGLLHSNRSTVHRRHCCTITIPVNAGLPFTV